MAVDSQGDKRQGFSQLGAVCMAVGLCDADPMDHIAFLDVLSRIFIFV
jgi:hypothetical protein